MKVALVDVAKHISLNFRPDERPHGRNLGTQQSVGTAFALPGLEPLLDIKKAAKILGISVSTLRDWVWQRKIDYVKEGRRVMFEPDALRAHIQKNRVRALVN